MWRSSVHRWLPVGTVVVGLLLGLVMAPAPAWADDSRARATYFEAVKACDAGQHDRCISLLDQTVRLLGGRTNLRVQPPLIRALHARGDLDRTRREIDRFFRLNPDPSLVVTAEIKQIKADVDQKIAAREARRRAEEAERRRKAEELRRAQDYLIGRAHEQARQAQAQLQNTQCHSLKRTEETYREYLRKYPRGPHAEEALVGARRIVEMVDTCERNSRNAQSARLMKEAEQYDQRARSHYLAATGWTVLGLGLAGAGVYLWAGEPLGEDASILTTVAGGGMLGYGLGILFFDTPEAIRKGDGQSDMADDLRNKARRLRSDAGISIGPAGFAITLKTHF